MIRIIKTDKKVFFSFTLLLTLLATSFSFANAESDINRAGCRKKIICADKVKAKTICADELIVKTGCCASYTITAKDFMDEDGNLSQTFVITEPGKYCLGERIDFAPVEDYFMPAIRIESNDVVLDLCGNTLNQVPNTAFDVAAIRIGIDPISEEDPVFKNITIKNGSITNFNGVGIAAENGAILFGAPVAFESLTFLDLNILDCGSTPNFGYFASGIALLGLTNDDLYDPATPVGFKNVVIENCNVNRCFDTAIFISTCDNIIVKNTQANECINEIALFNITAAYYITARNLQMFNCQGNGTTDLDPTALNAQVGSFIQNCINVYVKDCQFNDTFGEADSIINANLSNTQNAIFENCQFNNSRGGAGSNLVCGVHQSDSDFQDTQVNGFKFINCQFNGHTRVAEGVVPLGAVTGYIGIPLRNLIFEDCQACNISCEGVIDCCGFMPATSIRDTSAEVGSARNITFTNCITSDISGNANTVGFFMVSNPGRIQPDLGLGRSTNIVFQNCIAERIYGSTDTYKVAGICQGLSLGLFDAYPTAANLFVSNCRVSDVRSTAEVPSSFSAGILVESVHRPSLVNNSVSDCDRGILLTGTDAIFPNAFQLAATFDDATANPPVFIDLTAVPLLVTTDQVGVGPFNATLVPYSPVPFAPVIDALAGIADPIDACSPLLNDLSAKIGVCREGLCNRVYKTMNVDDAGAVATIIVVANTSRATAIETVGTGPTVTISTANGNALIAAINANPGIKVTIDSVPSSEVAQLFENTTNNTIATVVPGDVFDGTKGTDDVDFLRTPENLTELNWQTGDSIVYNNNGQGNIDGLVDGTTYYAIVYRPGFAENGVIMNNSVDNCTVSGYQDDKPTTSSAWVNNFAFNSGSPASADANYDIAWAGTAPVYAGDLADYPIGSAKAFNISLIQ